MNTSTQTNEDEMFQHLRSYLADGFEQDLIFLRECYDLGFNVIQLRAPSIEDNRDSWNRLVCDEKIFVNHYPKTDNCPIGKADTGNPAFSNITAKKLQTEKVYRDTFKEVARLLPNGYINRYYVVHYSKIYKKHKKVVIKKEDL